MPLVHRAQRMGFRVYNSRHGGGGDPGVQRALPVVYVSRTKSNAAVYPTTHWDGHGGMLGEVFCHDGTPPMLCILEGQALLWDQAADGTWIKPVRWSKKADAAHPNQGQIAILPEYVTWQYVYFYPYPEARRLDRAGTFAAAGPEGDTAHRSITVTNNWDDAEWRRRLSIAQTWHMPSDLVAHQGAVTVPKIAPATVHPRRAGETQEQADVRAAQERHHRARELPHRAGLPNSVMDGDPAGAWVMDP